MVKSKNRLFGDIATNVDATTGRIDSASLDSDIATTDTSSNFASGLQSGGVDVAADANLNSFLTAFTLPTVDGSAGQYLKTNGSGTFGLKAYQVMPLHLQMDLCLALIRLSLMAWKQELQPIRQMRKLEQQ